MADNPSQNPTTQIRQAEPPETQLTEAPQAPVVVQGIPIAPNLYPTIGIMTPQIMVPVQTVQAQQTLQVWQGPYPPPEAIERYEKILPGTFNRILTMAENLQQAQIDQSRNAIHFARQDTRRG